MTYFYCPGFVLDETINKLQDFCWVKPEREQARVLCKFIDKYMEILATSLGKWPPWSSRTRTPWHRPYSERKVSRPNPSRMTNLRSLQARHEPQSSCQTQTNTQRTTMRGVGPELLCPKQKMGLIFVCTSILWRDAWRPPSQASPRELLVRGLAKGSCTFVRGGILRPMRSVPSSIPRLVITRSDRLLVFVVFIYIMKINI